MISAKEHDNIIGIIDGFLGHKRLLSERKMKLFCYYTIKGKSKKLLFYINPRPDEIVFGIGHRWTDIMERFPLLPSMADETKQSVMKFSIKRVEDIEKKGIQKIIDLITEDDSSR